MLALALALPGCSKKEPDWDGFGIFKIGVSTPADGYSCRPDGEQTTCFLNPSPSIAGHKTTTDLFFRGLEEDAPLVEILVGIDACQPGPIGADLTGKLGEPAERAARRSLWRLKKMTVVALLPREADLCVVHFLDPSEKARIAELFPGVP